MTARMNCERFETLLGDRLDGTLGREFVIEMDEHLARCADCRALLGEMEALSKAARALPPRLPGTDLWPSIAAQLGAQDAPLMLESSTTTDHMKGSSTAVRVQRAWFASPQMLAAAAVLLIAFTAGVTWTVARSAGPVVQTTAQASNVKTDSTIVVATNDPLAEAERMQLIGGKSDPKIAGQSDEARWAAIEASYVANSVADVDAIYEREISALRSIVDERFAELDSTTVRELRRNLSIIDKAVEDSRKALERDPNSRKLSTKHNRALEKKLELMRQVALL